MKSYYLGLFGAHLPAPQGKSLLDVGCGMGFALRAMREFGFDRVHGIDTSSEQIAACQRLGESCELVDDTRAYLSASSSRYDVILLLDVLEHVPVGEQIDLARVLRDVLTPGGTIIISVPNATSPLAARYRYGDFTHYSSFTEHSLQFVLLNAGFSRVEIPGQGPLRRPPLRFWNRNYLQSLRRWIVRFVWRQIVVAELSPTPVDSICTELNLLCVARK